MHILILALHWPLAPTGVCRHAANLAKCLAETDAVNKVTLVIGEWQTHYFETSFDLSASKIKLFSVAIRNTSLSRNTWFLWGLPKLVNSLKPDVVHMSFPFPFFRQSFKSAVVSTIHDLYPYECPENFGYPRVWFNQFFLRQCIHNSDALSCVSKQTLESLKHYFPNIDLHKKTDVAYNYVDFSHINSMIPEKMDFAENSTFILCVAQHRKNKNLDLLIKSYALLLEKAALEASTKLLIVGSSGPETENILHLIQTLNLQKQVILLSSIKDENLCWLYKKCRLFVIPSSTEGFCIPLVEALFFTCRVVCSDIPIFREVGSSKCNYFDLSNEPVANLAKAISSALSKPIPSQQYTDLRFSKKNVAQQLLHFYASGLESSFRPVLST